MRFPRLITFAVTLTLLYPVLRWVFDRDPAAEPLPQPYHFLRHLERDATLRSAHYGSEQQARRQPPVARFPFLTAADVAILGLAHPEFVLRHAAEGLIEGDGSLEIQDRQARGAVVLRVTGHSGNLEGIAVSGRWKVTPVAPGPYRGEARVRVEWESSRRPTGLTVGLPPQPPLPDHTAPARGEDCWQEFEVYVPAPLRTAPDPTGVTVHITLSHTPGTVLIDELQVTACSRLRSLLQSTVPARAGVTETTRALKRLVRRGADERLCLALPPDSNLTYELEPPARARLDLGYTTLADPQAQGTAQLVVAISRLGEFEETLLRLPLDGTRSGQFTDQQLDLTRFGGDRVRLQFRVTHLTAASGPCVLLADPVLTSPPERPRPHVLVVAYPEGASLRGGGFARLTAEGILLSLEAEPSPSVALQRLCLLASTAAPATAVPAQPAPLLLADEWPTLTEQLRAAGFQELAALGTTGQPASGWLTQGITRRADGSRGNTVAASLAFLDRHGATPCVVLLDLPVADPGAALQRLLEQLQSRQLLEHSLLCVVPARAPGLSWLRLPGSPQRDSSSSTPWHVTDVAPTLTALLDLPVAAAWSGRVLTLDMLTGQQPVPPRAARPPGLRWAPRLPPREVLHLQPGQVAAPRELR